MKLKKLLLKVEKYCYSPEDSLRLYISLIHAALSDLTSNAKIKFVILSVCCIYRITVVLKVETDIMGCIAADLAADLSPLFGFYSKALLAL